MKGQERQINERVRRAGEEKIMAEEEERWTCLCVCVDGRRACASV